MNNNIQQWIVAENDVINFDLKIKNKLSNDEPIKISDQKMTIGANVIASEIDKQLIGFNINHDRLLEIELKIHNNINIFGHSINPGDYIFSFKIKEIDKNANQQQSNKTANIKLDEENKEQINNNQTVSNENNNKETELKNLIQEINNLKDLNNLLKDKIQKLEEEKSANELSFKLKAEEIAKNAVEKIEIIKQEIKVKAKEEIENKSKFATQKLVENLIGPINNLDIVIESGSSNSNPAITGYVKGFQMILSQIVSTLESNGIKTISPNIGDEYKPEIHEAQEVVESNEFPKDKIIKVVSKGYTLHERVIKPAIVIVAK